MKKVMLALAALVCSAAAVQANPYAGVAAGLSHIDINCEGARTCEDRGTGFKVYGGYQFTPNVAGELVYLNFGTVHVADPGVSLDLKVHGFGGGVAFHVPLATQWNLLARLGVVSIRTKADASVTGTGSGSASEWSRGPTAASASATCSARRSRSRGSLRLLARRDRRREGGRRHAHARLAHRFLNTPPGAATKRPLTRPFFVGGRFMVRPAATIGSQAVETPDDPAECRRDRRQAPVQ